MARVGNKQNSFINGEWAKHADSRQATSKLRRAYYKRIDYKEQKETPVAKRPRFPITNLKPTL